MKVIAKETLIMSGVIVNVGETVDLDEGTIANIRDLVEPAPTAQSKVPPVKTTPEEPKVPAVKTTPEEPKVPTESDPSTETKKEGK